MALHFPAFADLIARQVRSRPRDGALRTGPDRERACARLSMPGAVATMMREGGYWRVTFERTGHAVTMSSRSGERFDAVVAGNVGGSIATFLAP